MTDRFAKYFAEFFSKGTGRMALQSGQQVPAPPRPLPYKAFTKAFDQEVSAASALRAAQGSAAPRDAGLGFGSTIVSPANTTKAEAMLRGIEFQKKWSAGHDLGPKPLITLLIDHSGSMRGLRAMTAALVADAIGTGLEFNEIAFDVLGYTTNSWRGGESRNAWFKAGCPPYPGRLCDLLHIVYRDALQHGGKNTRWRDDLTLLLHDDVLKENIDGEALEWAYERAKRFEASTWICFVISDGAPVDDTTLILNGPNILLDHLSEASIRIGAETNVRLGGIGFEFDIGRYYPTSKSIKVLAEAPVIAFDVLEQLIWPPETADPNPALLH